MYQVYQVYHPSLSRGGSLFQSIRCIRCIRCIRVSGVSHKFESRWLTVSEYQEYQVYQSIKSIRCFSRSRELFHGWFLVEKVVESLPGMVGELSSGDSNLVRLCLAFESMRENCEQIASKLLGIFSGRNHV